MESTTTVNFVPFLPESKCAKAVMTLSKELTSHVKTSRAEYDALEVAVILSLVLLFFTILMAIKNALFPKRLYATPPAGPQAI